jgi:hypothetical protein
MDMKRILQAIDGVTTKPVVGVDSMAKFLRTVTEAEINQIPAMPDITGLQTGQPKDLGNGSKVTVNADGTVSYQGGWGTYVYNAQGQHIKTQSPSMAGYSQETDPTGNVTQQNYNQGPMDIQKGPQGTTANYQLGDINATANLKEDGLSKFLSIVRKNDVSILNEGSNPHKVALPVQMTMQHYQQAESSTSSNTPSLLKKYFHEVESEINEQAQAKRQAVNQYASVIAERVLKKRSKKKILNEGELEVLRPADKSDDYDSVRFKIDGEPVEPGSEQFDYYYKLVFKKDPPNKFVDTLKGMMSEPHGSMGADPHKDSENDVQDGDVIIPAHEKGEWVKIRDIVEAPIEMDPSEPNNPTIYSHQKANTMSLKGRIMSARAQLRELAQLAESDSLLAWEEICKKSKGGMFMGLEQNLEQIRHGISELAAKRRKGGVNSRGIDKNIGEQDVTEMDKSQTPPGRDSGPRRGPDREAKPITPKKATKDAEDVLTKTFRDSHKKDVVADPQLKSKFEELLSKF